MNKLLDKIENFDDFPTLPTIYYKLVDALSNTSTTIKDLSNLVSTDIALSFKLLKIVNSSIYGLSTKVNSIDKAIFHLGFRELKNIILSTKIIEVFSDINSNSKFDLVEFWKHSIAVGTISRIIAQELGQKNLDEYLLSGITHDIGKLVLIKILGSEYNVVFILMEKENISLLEAEQKILGITHQEIGLKLAESWNLDKNILNVIRYHNDGLIGSNYDQLVGVVHISNILAKLLNLGHSGCDRISQPNQLLWRRLDITRFDKNIIYDRIETDYEQAKEILIIN
ncbi:MAG: HDOD domain-containing protein [Candidatus Kapaibacterium sp.]|nr:HDOD domain-containing protein [Ignavibacteriota bacterium]